MTLFPEVGGECRGNGLQTAWLPRLPCPLWLTGVPQLTLGLHVVSMPAHGSPGT